MRQCLVAFCVAAFAGAYICLAVSDSDIWLHITIGRNILASGGLPTTELWNRFSVGSDWLPYPWVFQIMSAGIWDAWGPTGLVLCKVILGVLLASVLAWTYSLLSSSVFTGTLIAVITAFAAHAHFGLKPDVIAWICFALVIVLAHGVSKLQCIRFSSAVGVVGIFCLWSNSHPSTLFGLVCLISLLGSQSRRRLIGSCIGLCFIGTLLTPVLFLGPHRILSRFCEAFVHPSLFQLLPASFDLYPVSFLLLQLAVLFTLLHYRSGLLSLRLLVALTLFVIAGMSSMPLLPFAFIYTSALIAKALPQLGESSGALGNLTSAALRFRQAVTRIPSAAACALCILYLSGKAAGLLREPIAQKVLPEAAVSFVLENNLPDPVLNSFGDGPYLMFRFSDERGVPSRLVSVDTRLESNDAKIVALHDGASQGMSTWREYVRRVNPGVIIWPTSSALSTILSAGTTWCRDTDAEGWSVFTKCKEAIPAVPQ
ncbi:MAG: hypothetical protein KDD66_04685 [Bdellovibrionales bacterium]|nr:hypothetical protein [Bdellovibrionales bacterium]